jgi:hypothetical protein
MTISPIVRYMILCDDWHLDGPTGRRVTIVGLLWSIHSVDDPPFPLCYREVCVFLALMESRGQGEGQVICIFEDTGEKVFETSKFLIRFPQDPLEVVGLPVRIRDCIFPRPGRYSVQFWYDGVLIEERPLRLR